MNSIALIGASGTGKTTTLERVRQLRPEWKFLTEATRDLVPILGYDTPWAIVDEFGIAYYEAIMLSYWNVLTQLHSEMVLIDGSPLDNFAYYLICRRGNEVRYEKILRKMCEFYSKSISRYILFPVGVFEFVHDEMRVVDLQREHDQALRSICSDFQVTFYELKSISVEDRAHEVIREAKFK